MTNSTCEKKCNFDFKNWTILRKITFIFGVIVLAITLLSLVLTWLNTSIKLDKIIKELEAANPGIIAKIQASKAAPSFIGNSWKYTQTFTYMSNFLLGISMVLFGYFYNNKRIQKTFFISVVYITITFAIYWSLIFPKVFGAKYTALALFTSTNVHAINPFIGILILIFNRKNIVVDKKLMFLSNLGVIGYFVLAFVIFWLGRKYSGNFTNNYSNKANVLSQYVDSDIVVYSFLNFIEPFFYRGGKIAIVIALNVLMIVIAIFAPIGLSYFWKSTLRIKFENKVTESIKNE
ncbi:hypothetical protein NPA07_03895 [Mycoplasmopsis caviae]|uniref:Uncharacterized protein n=1 Tax=Mycoplasmopsis caviae TaxID=55603 RepID=A0A3P8L7J9_9BACT|nr:hypothetical protein [Mycoplasmopsis caviae]UUD34927.1 hypothetical protein NPA07_03895 [Mycoplasmopsis caviae]VDR42245.1 Uncharacterised protein [Mycoplasmopsis caviae]